MNETKDELLDRLTEGAKEVLLNTREKAFGVDWIAKSNQSRIKQCLEEIERSESRIMNDLAMIELNKREIQQRESVAILLDTILQDVHEEMEVEANEYRETL